MLRKFASVVAVLVICASVAMAADKKADKAKAKGKAVQGTVEKFEDGKLTIKLGKKAGGGTKEFTLGDTTKIVVFSAEEKQELTGSQKDAVSKALAVGTRVGVVAGEDGKATMVRIGTPKKKAK